MSARDAIDRIRADGVAFDRLIRRLAEAQLEESGETCSSALAGALRAAPGRGGLTKRQAVERAYAWLRAAEAAGELVGELRPGDGMMRRWFRRGGNGS